MAQHWNAAAVRLSRRASALLASDQDRDTAVYGLLRTLETLPLLGVRQPASGIGMFVAFRMPEAPGLPPQEDFEELVALAYKRVKGML